MSNFNQYAHYYDLFYADKDNVAEVAFVLEQLNKVSPQRDSLIDWGCGTGRHTSLLVPAFKKVIGVDLGPGMIANAQKKYSQTPELEFQVGNICQKQLGLQAHAAVSLFHVISYLTEDNLLSQAFQNIKKHLFPGAPFLFDFWYGPAVLQQKIEKRTRCFENEDYHVERTAIPEHYPDRRVVEVNYFIKVRDKKNNSIQEFEEKHPMRYFNPGELEEIIKKAGLQVVYCAGWLKDTAPTPEDWGAYMLCQRPVAD